LVLEPPNQRSKWPLLRRTSSSLNPVCPAISSGSPRRDNESNFVVWWDSGKLPKSVVPGIQRENDLYVGVASVWELAIKSALGKNAIRGELWRIPGLRLSGIVHQHRSCRKGVEAVHAPRRIPEASGLQTYRRRGQLHRPLLHEPASHTTPQAPQLFGSLRGLMHSPRIVAPSAPASPAHIKELPEQPH
jgi:hypothetical protein